MRRRDRFSLAAGGAALLVSVLAVGSVFRWAQALVGGLVAIALALQVSSRRKLDRISPIVVLLALATLFTALQLVPLPESWLEALNGTGQSLRSDGALLAETHPWSVISMDPAATLRCLGFFVTLLAVALLSLRIAASDRGRFAMIAGVALTCGIAALVTAIHMLVNADSLYGLYEPVHAAPPILGPLLNPNHLGCLMAFGATLSVGLAFYEKQSAQWRAVWVISAVACASIALASQSRGAAISLALSLALTSGILVARRFGDLTSRRAGQTFKQLPIVFVLAIGMSLAVYAGAGDVVDQLDRTSLVEAGHPTSKFAAWRASVSLVAETPWVGVGRGAVESTMTRVFDSSAYHTYSHLENEYISAIVEWGVPEALVLALVLAWCLVTAIRRWRDGPLAAAAIGAIAGVMFQSSVDFGIELLGVAVPVTIVACAVQIVPLRETSRLTGLRVQRLALIAALLGCAGLVMLPMSRSLQEDHDMLVDMRTPDLPTVFGVIERHPVDYFGFGRAAETMLQNNDPRAIAFLNQGLMLEPAHPGLHRLTARVLLARGHRAQASVEYELALRGTQLPHSLLTEIVSTMSDPRDAAASIPLDYFDRDRITMSLTELKHQDVLELWLLRILRTGTHDLGVIDQLYNLALAHGDNDAAHDAAVARLAEAHTQTSRLMLARVEFEQKQYDKVEKDLADVERWSGRLDERGDAWLLLCDTYSEQKRWDDALQCIHHLDVTPMMAMRHDEIVKREGAIADSRSAEVKLKEIQDLEKSMNLPIDMYLPVIQGQGSAAPAGQSIPGIHNPLARPPENPLLHSETAGHK